MQSIISRVSTNNQIVLNPLQIIEIYNAGMLFPTKLTPLTNTLGLIGSSSPENHHNKRCNSGSHRWPNTFLGRCISSLSFTSASLKSVLDKHSWNDYQNLFISILVVVPTFLEYFSHAGLILIKEKDRFLRDFLWKCTRARAKQDLTYCSYKHCDNKPGRSVLITMIAWYFQVHLVNVTILNLKYEYGIRGESHFACFSHCYVTWYPLMTRIVTSQCPSAGILRFCRATQHLWYRPV